MTMYIFLISKTKTQTTTDFGVTKNAHCEDDKPTMEPPNVTIGKIRDFSEFYFVEDLLD